MSEDLENVYNNVEDVKNSELLNQLSDGEPLITMYIVQYILVLHLIYGFSVDKEDINQFANRIIDRCETVNIHVLTTRSESQQNCLEEINTMIDSIVNTLREDPDNAKAMCQSYIASCSSSENEFGCKEFEMAVLGCTLDDQKLIIKRLQGLLDYIMGSKDK